MSKASVICPHLPPGSGRLCYFCECLQDPDEYRRKEDEKYGTKFSSAGCTVRRPSMCGLSEPPKWGETHWEVFGNTLKTPAIRQMADGSEVILSPEQEPKRTWRDFLMGGW